MRAETIPKMPLSHSGLDIMIALILKISCSFSSFLTSTYTFSHNCWRVVLKSIICLHIFLMVVRFSSIYRSRLVSAEPILPLAFIFGASLNAMSLALQSRFSPHSFISVMIPIGAFFKSLSPRVTITRFSSNKSTMSAIVAIEAIGKYFFASTMPASA